jgi:hypothetical protein
LTGDDSRFDGAPEGRGDPEKREVVGPGGPVLDRSHSLSSHPGPPRHLSLAQLELGSAPGEESAGAVKFGQNIGKGLVATGIE